MQTSELAAQSAPHLVRRVPAVEVLVDEAALQAVQQVATMFQGEGRCQGPEVLLQVPDAELRLRVLDGVPHLPHKKDTYAEAG